MKKIAFILVLPVILVCNCFSQDKTLDSLFSTSLFDNLSNYKLKAHEAYVNHDYAKGKSLFKDFVSHNLTNSYLDDFKAKKLNGALININNYFKKPVILITYSSWCVREKGEIPALNELAKKYHKKIDFVILFWDNQNDARKQAKLFNSKINILYVDERENKFCNEIRHLKHALGFPLAFYMDSENRIMDIKKKTADILKPKKTYLESYAHNYNEFVDGLNTLLLTGEIVKEHYVGK